MITCSAEELITSSIRDYQELFKKLNIKIDLPANNLHRCSRNEKNKIIPIPILNTDDLKKQRLVVVWYILEMNIHMSNVSFIYANVGEKFCLSSSLVAAAAGLHTKGHNKQRLLMLIQQQMARYTDGRIFVCWIL